MFGKYRWATIGVVFLLACAAEKTPSEKVASQFMDHYYVRTDLQKAQEDCDGLARQKVEESIRLTEGQLVDVTTRRPKIFYKLLESRIDGPEASYLYEVEIRPDGMKELRRKTRLRARERGEGVWKITQFSDQDDG